MSRLSLAPWGSLVLLVVLTGSAAGFSLTTAPRAPIPPFENDPAASSELNQAVEGTLHASSFVATVTIRVAGEHPFSEIRRFIYESPDRTEVTGSGLTEITIGDAQYVNVVGSAIVSQKPWLAVRLSQVHTGLSEVRPTLNELAKAVAVRRNGNLFHAFEEAWVPPPPAPFHEAGGWAVITATAVVSQGRLIREDMNVVTFPISDHLPEESITFTDIDTAPPINVPPVNEVQWSSCGHLIQPGLSTPSC